MNKGGDEVPIASRDYWFKNVDFLQQSWALVDKAPAGVVVWFFGDTSGVFDEISFPTETAAIDALKRNGFRRHSEDPQAQDFIRVPAPPFRRRHHPSGRIYSTGRFWT
jgi:hypothetical protein